MRYFSAASCITSPAPEKNDRRKWKSILYVIASLAIFTSAISCNDPTRYMTRDDIYYLRLDDGSCAFKKFNISKLKLIVKTNHTFCFEPCPDILKPYEGKWHVDISVDGIGDYQFDCINGREFSGPSWYNVTIDSISCDLLFSVRPNNSSEPY